MYKVPIVDAPLVRLMYEYEGSFSLFLSTDGKRDESLTRPSDAVRHEARPIDTPRFVASHPRCRVFYLPRIQLSRGSCSNDGRRFRFIFRRRVLDLVNDHARQRSSRFLGLIASQQSTRCGRILRKRIQSRRSRRRKRRRGPGETSERIPRFNLCAA